MNRYLKTALLTLPFAFGIASAQNIHNMDSLLLSQKRDRTSLNRVLTRERIDPLFVESQRLNEITMGKNQGSVKDRCDYVFNWVSNNITFEFCKKVEDWESTKKTLDDRVGSCAQMAPLAFQMLEKLGVPSFLVGEYTNKNGERWVEHIYNVAYTPKGYLVFDCIPQSRQSPKFHDERSLQKLLNKNDQALLSQKTMTGIMHWSIAWDYCHKISDFKNSGAKVPDSLYRAAIKKLDDINNVDFSICGNGCTDLRNGFERELYQGYK